MADTIPVTCPNCQKKLTVPVALAGKKIRCKDCQTAVPIPGGKPDPDVLRIADDDEPVKKAKPAKARPVAKAKPAAAPVPPPPAPKRPSDDDDDATPYAAGFDDSLIARCPFCAKELDPPDTLVCLNCGYDLIKRRRHTSKKVYETTVGDYFIYHLPTIAAVLTIIGLIVLNLFCWANMSDWFKDSVFEKDEVEATTQRKQFWIGPGFSNTWIAIISLVIMWIAGRFIYKRVRYDWKPVEIEKK